MVFFICSACGESIKKNQVEKHCQFKCRNCQFLSCVDCGKDFRGNDYQQHIKCISEDEKYGGKDYKLKASANKGERKQEEWIMQVQAAIQKCDDWGMKKWLEQLENYPNIPRKKPKFLNFLKSCLRVPYHLHGRMWDAISAELNKQKDASQNGDDSSSKQDIHANDGSNKTAGNDSNTNGMAKDSDETENEAETKKLSKRERKEERKRAKHKAEKKDKQVMEEEKENIKKKKKRKRSHEEEEEESNVEHSNDAETKKKKKKKSKDKDEDEPASKKKKLDHQADAEEEQEADEAPAAKFKWEHVIVAVLQKQGDHELAIKKLRKKVLSEYYACYGDTAAHEENKLQSKFIRKVTKNPRLRVLKDKVKLIS